MVLIRVMKTICPANIICIPSTQILEIWASRQVLHLCEVVGGWGGVTFIQMVSRFLSMARLTARGRPSPPRLTSRTSMIYVPHKSSFKGLHVSFRSIRSQRLYS